MSTESALRIVWVYPDLLSTYGDRGNLLILSRRADLRGLPVECCEVRSDQPVPVDADIYLLGGGEDGPQALAAERLIADGGLGTRGRPPGRGTGRVRRVPAARRVVLRQGPAVRRTRTAGHAARTGDRAGRSVNWPARSTRSWACRLLTGFENHGGRTHLGPGVRALAKVTAGIGNDGTTEGAWQRQRARHLFARAGAVPQPGARRPAAALGDRDRDARSARRHLVRQAARRATRARSGRCERGGSPGEPGAGRVRAATSWWRPGPGGRRRGPRGRRLHIVAPPRRRVGGVARAGGRDRRGHAAAARRWYRARSSR